ncbi:hypothetical protein H2204_012045 [Knufia peltigerae]|nr:hypothetical protein H2204_012045 [Knufia peltigerae]
MAPHTLLIPVTRNVYRSTRFSYFLSGPQGDRSAALGVQITPGPETTVATVATVINEHENSDTSVHVCGTHDASLREQFFENFAKARRELLAAKPTSADVTDMEPEHNDSPSSQYGDDCIALLPTASTNSPDGNVQRKRITKREHSISIKEEQSDVELRRV